MSTSREMASRRKDNIKIKVLSKVPKLNKIINDFIEELQDPCYLDIKSNTHEILKKIAKNEEICQTIIHKKNSILIY
jgi:ABC-type uncharacterized transport system substrate-binding protein